MGCSVALRATPLTAGFGYGEGLLIDKFVFEEGIAMSTTLATRWKLLPSSSACRSVCLTPPPSTPSSAMLKALGPQAAGRGDIEDKVYKVHANIMWQPVKQMRMGWEVLWAQKEYTDGSDADAVRASFATYFFF
jgi:hypothetical protein